MWRVDYSVQESLGRRCCVKYYATNRVSAMLIVYILTVLMYRALNITVIITPFFILHICKLYMWLCTYNFTWILKCFLPNCTKSHAIKATFSCTLLWGKETAVKYLLYDHYTNGEKTGNIIEPYLQISSFLTYSLMSLNES